MDFNKPIVTPILLKGVNYLLWSRTIKTTLCSRGLWPHILSNEPPTQAIEGAEREEHSHARSSTAGQWFQEDQLVLSVLQNSLDSSLLAAYSYCENAKELWDTLSNVYGNTSNLMRIFEIKKALGDLRQEGVDFTKHYGEFRALWAELDMLRPDTNDQAIRLERKEEDKVFGLFLTLSSSYSDLIHHLLRQDKLPTLEAVCARIQREQGSHNLFGNKGELVLANKSYYQGNEKKIMVCSHCKLRGHSKDHCWKLHPHLKPAGM